MCSSANLLAETQTYNKKKNLSIGGYSIEAIWSMTNLTL